MLFCKHRCTVAGNPGGAGGPWFFLANSFLRVVLGVVRKSGGSPFIAFLCGSFSKIFIGGTSGAPLSPPPPCASMYVSYVSS